MHKRIIFAQHRYLNTRVLVEGSSTLELVEIAVSMFVPHALQEVGAFLSWVTVISKITRSSIILAMPLC